MSRTNRRHLNRDLPAFSRWLKAWLSNKASAEGTSIRRLVEERGANRSNLNRWQALTNDMDGPTRESVDREFDLLRIPEGDRVEPYSYLGWAVPTGGERMTSLDAKIKRAEALLRTDLSENQRAEYQRMLDDYKATYELLLDRFFDRVQADLAERNPENSRDPDRE